MFTGLVEATGKVISVASTATGRRITIDPGDWGHLPETGASISVSGCCLTVVAATSRGFDFDVIHRSLEVTTLGGLTEGDEVNLEKSATLETLLGGHLVQGHVDAVGVVAEVDDGDDWRIRIDAPPEVARHLVDRGSIAIDGVSLTVARVLGDGGDRFEVALIPETLERTTLAARRPGDRVNLEADAMSKMIERHVSRLLEARGLSAG